MMLKDEKLESLQVLLEEHWDDVGRYTFDENSEKLLGNRDLLVLAGSAIHTLVMVDPTGEKDGPQAICSLLVGLIKRAYQIGKESMIQ